MWGSDMCSSQKPFVCKSEFYDFVPDYRYIGVFGPDLKLLFLSEIDKKLGPVLPCDDGWELHGHHCVKVNLEKMNWFQVPGSLTFVLNLFEILYRSRISGRGQLYQSRW